MHNKRLPVGKRMTDTQKVDQALPQAAASFEQINGRVEQMLVDNDLSLNAVAYGALEPTLQAIDRTALSMLSLQ